MNTPQNGVQSYERFTKNNTGEYPLFFTDMQMQVMNGYEAAWLMRDSKHPRAESVSIIGRNANAYAQDVKKALDSGMNGQIAKPISIDVMSQTIRVATKDTSTQKENTNDDR